MAKTDTIVINNFGGRLTRILNGDLNSGFAKFDASFGYDPFTKPMNLTWLGQPSSIPGTTELIMAGINQTTAGGFSAGTEQQMFALGYGGGTLGGLYRIKVNETSGVVLDVNEDSVIGRRSVAGKFEYGASLEFFGPNRNLFIGADNAIIIAGSVTGVGSYNEGHTSVIVNTNLLDVPRPLKKYGGNLTFGNGPSIGLIGPSHTVISSVFTISAQRGPQWSQLNPPLPSDQIVRDLDVTVDSNYLNISASDVFPSKITQTRWDDGYASPGTGGIYGWNGVDATVTTALTIPGGTAAALQVYLGENRLFLNDAFGAAVSNGIDKILTLPNNAAPLPNATGTNGNFLTWMNPEVVGIDDTEATRVGSLYYFGSLDQENPVGLYRLLRFEAPIANGFVYQVPYQAVVSNAYRTVSNSYSSTRSAGYGKHYFSAFCISSVITSASTAGAFQFQRFTVSGDPTQAPQEGVYETQTQMFQKRIHVEQIRVYTEPTIANNGFQLDIIGVDGDPITNGTFTYSFAAGTDITRLQGALQRINFNPSADAGYGFGIRLTNTGTTNMTIKKVEVDWGPEGK